MPKKILLINSDLAENRGDRAIAEGNIQLIKRAYPDAIVTGISQFPERDANWYGIDFLRMNFQSLSPISFLRLCLFARTQDFILWGGGEILKDYTNKAALWYWVFKITGISFFNKNIYGFFQGIGPTKSTSSKTLIAFIVRRCRKFIVRDKESYDKLVAWGVPKTQLWAASDPAVLPRPEKLDRALKEKLKKNYQIDDKFLDNFVCIGPRDWFHYRPGGLIPYKYRRRIYSLLKITIAQDDEAHTTYMAQLDSLVKEVTTAFNVNILFVPMHIGESDSQLCQKLTNAASSKVQAVVLDKDFLSPAELRSLMAKSKAMIGFRLHSNIIGTSASVPSVNIYYVDKGRVFFDQIGQSRFAMPIEEALKSDFVDNVHSLLAEIMDNRKAMQRQLDKSTDELRHTVMNAADEILHDA